MRIIALLCLGLLMSCGSHKKKDESPVDDGMKAALLKKRDLYLSLQPTALDTHGYAHDKCDSLGFTSLCKAAGGCESADVFASETDGRWYRSPEKDCFDLGESKSDFSKDMALMLFVYLHELAKTDGPKAADAITRFRNYVKANNYVMGRPTDNPEGLSRVVMSPGLITLMERLYSKLTLLPGDPEPAGVVDVVPVITDGFQAHLDVLSIWLGGELTGKITDSDKYVLSEQAKRQPFNALFLAVHHLYKDGDQSAALQLLSDEVLFPSDRLPTSEDRCEEYIYQRDRGDDWDPCEGDRVHDGVDYLFTGHLAGFW
jgi:hypothetical protein